MTVTTTYHEEVIEARPKRRFREWLYFFVGACVLSSTGIGAAFGFFLALSAFNEPSPTRLWLICTGIGKFVTIAGSILVILAALVYGIGLAVFA